MRTVTQDNFTDTDETLLENHTPNVGQAWTKLGTPTLKIVGNEVVFTTGLTRYQANPAPDTNIYRVSASLWRGAFPAGGLSARYTSTSSNYYFFFHSSAVELRKNASNGGGGTLLGSYNQTFSSTSWYAFLLDMAADGAKKLSVDGVERISSTDDTVTDIGYAVLELRNASNKADTFLWEQADLILTVYDAHVGYDRGPVSLALTDTICAYFDGPLQVVPNYTIVDWLTAHDLPVNPLNNQVLTDWLEMEMADGPVSGWAYHEQILVKAPVTPRQTVRCPITRSITVKCPITTAVRVTAKIK